MTREEEINKIIQDEKLDTHLISDGNHTFGELYDHRIALYVVLCRKLDDTKWEVGDYQVWKSKLHNDGTMWEGWFIVGIGKEKGHQLTYHLPLSCWDDLDVEILDRAPKWDGHTPADVIQRLKAL